MNIVKIMFLNLIAAMVFWAASCAAQAGTEPVIEEAVRGMSAEATKSFITKKSKDGPFKLVVLGDSLADGLYSGLYRLNRQNQELTIKKASRVNTGLVRSDRYDWNKGAAKIASSGEYQIAVVLLGLNDLQTFRQKGKRHHFQQKGWEAIYEARIEKMITDLKDAGLAIYWVGIPITSPKRYQKQYAYLNNFFKKAAAKHQVRYVDTWSPLAGADGKYSPFWRDAAGKQQQIRRRDGVHFTTDGYLVFAQFVNDILQRDIRDVLQKQAAK